MGKIGKTKTKSKAPGPDQQLKFVGPRDVPSATKNFTWAKATMAVPFVLDIIACFLLFGSIHWWWGASKPPHWSPEALWAMLTDFPNDSLDLILLTLLRVPLLGTLAVIASQYAYAEGWNMEAKHARGGGKACGKDCKRSNGSHLAAASPGTAATKGPPFQWLWMKKDELTTPLLSAAAAAAAAHNGHEEDGKEEEHCPVCADEHEDDDKHKIITPLKDEPETGFQEWVGSVAPKDVVLFVSFLLCTVFQVYVGAKCVSFLFTREALQGVLMGSAVVWINLESYSLSRLAEASGVLGRAAALAALVALKEPKGRSSSAGEADISGAQEDGPGDISVTTSASGSMSRAALGLKLAQLTTAEDVLRGDKGVREEKVVSPFKYLMRAIALAYDELPLLSVGFLCLTVTSTAGLIIPRYQGKILDDVIQMDQGKFKHDVMLMAIFSLVTGIFGGLRGLSFSIVGKRILKTLQDRLFSGVVIQDIAYFDSTTSGELTSRLTNDVSAMSEPINWQLSALLRNFFQLGGGVILCFWTSWKLSMLAFTTMQPIMHITSVYSRWSRDLNRHRYAVLAEANSAASEAFSNIRTVRAFSTEDVETDRYKSKTRTAMLKGVRDAVAYSGAVAINNWLDLGASVLILWYGGYLVMGGRLSIGQLITYQLYWGLIQNGYQSVMSVLTSLTKASGAAQRVLSLVDALPDIDPNSGTKVSKLKGAVAFDDVHFHYQMRPDNPVLQGISLSIQPGQVCALVGRSGGGKSTLVHLLMRYYDPTGGRVLLDGQDLKTLNLTGVHHRMGLVAQDTQMWACSIEENIAYGLPSYTRAQVEEAAKFANAHSFICGFPEGYATRVGERGVRLSGGQRQRIAIARMLLRKPDLLVLDEATSALDTESEALVQEALDRLIAEGGRTIILVAHRLSTVRNADIIGVIDQGRIVEQGTHEILVKRQNGVYEKLVRRQLSKSRNTIGGIQEANPAGANDRIDQLLNGDDV